MKDILKSKIAITNSLVLQNMFIEISISGRFIKILLGTLLGKGENSTIHH